MVSADCNSSVYQTASPFWGSLRLIIDTHPLFGGTIRTWDHYTSANPATYQERSNISGCGIDKTYLYNAFNYINLEASGPRLRLIRSLPVDETSRIIWEALQYSVQRYRSTLFTLNWFCSARFPHTPSSSRREPRDRLTSNQRHTCSTIGQLLLVRCHKGSWNESVF